MPEPLLTSQHQIPPRSSWEPEEHHTTPTVAASSGHHTLHLYTLIRHSKQSFEWVQHPVATVDAPSTPSLATEADVSSSNGRRRYSPTATTAQRSLMLSSPANNPMETSSSTCSSNGTFVEDLGPPILPPPPPPMQSRTFDQISPTKELRVQRKKSTATTTKSPKTPRAGDLALYNMHSSYASLASPSGKSKSHSIKSKKSSASLSNRSSSDISLYSSSSSSTTPVKPSPQRSTSQASSKNVFTGSSPSSAPLLATTPTVLRPPLPQIPSSAAPQRSFQVPLIIPGLIQTTPSESLRSRRKSAINISIDISARKDSSDSAENTSSAFETSNTPKSSQMTPRKRSPKSSSPTDKLVAYHLKASLDTFTSTEPAAISTGAVNSLGRHGSLFHFLEIQHAYVLHAWNTMHNEYGVLQIPKSSEVFSMAQDVQGWTHITRHNLKTQHPTAPTLRTYLPPTIHLALPNGADAGVLIKWMLEHDLPAHLDCPETPLSQASINLVEEVGSCLGARKGELELRFLQLVETANRLGMTDAATLNTIARNTRPESMYFTLEESQVWYPVYKPLGHWIAQNWEHSVFAGDLYGRFWNVNCIDESFVVYIAMLFQQRRQLDLSVSVLQNWCGSNLVRMKALAHRVADVGSNFGGEGASTEVLVAMMRAVAEVERKMSSFGGSVLDLEAQAAEAMAQLNESEEDLNDSQFGDFAALEELMRRDRVEQLREVRAANYECAALLTSDDEESGAEEQTTPAHTVLDSPTSIDGLDDMIQAPRSSPPPPPPSSFFEAADLTLPRAMLRGNSSNQHESISFPTSGNRDISTTTENDDDVYGLVIPRLSNKYKSTIMNPQRRRISIASVATSHLSMTSTIATALFPHQRARIESRAFSVNDHTQSGFFDSYLYASDAGHHDASQPFHAPPAVTAEPSLLDVAVFEFNCWKQQVKRLKNLYLELTPTPQTNNPMPLASPSDLQETRQDSNDSFSKPDVGVGAGPFGGDHVVEEEESVAGLGAFLKRIASVSTSSSNKKGKVASIPARLATAYSEEEFRWDEHCDGPPGDVVVASVLVVKDAAGHIVNSTVYPRRLQ
ncbi:hypothetical protein HDU80_006829 [Chytriomyces hyalinus]|nr:hypothetical protein HDU80_006829 [Chytriomyces hyalinus]